jgi:hypothetical protein
VLVAGGWSSSITDSAELYDPATGMWTPTGSLNNARYEHAAALLINGNVLVAGGNGPGNIATNAAEIYDPAALAFGTAGVWTETRPLNSARYYHTATLLASNQVLVAGGTLGTIGNPLSSAELYGDYGTSSSWRPQITTFTAPLTLGSNMVITGSLLRGVAEASSGTGQDSPGDYPLAQLRPLGGSQTLFLPSTGWSTSSFTSMPVTNFPLGYATLTMFVNGIPSVSKIVLVTTARPFKLMDPARLTGGAFQFSFTNTPGDIFSVYATTNLTFPFISWTFLGAVTDSPPGQFHFTDLQATNYPRRFYRASSP